MKTVEPKYILPSRTTFSRSIIPNMYESEAGKMKSLISYEYNETIPSLNLLCDGWSSRTLYKYLSFTISFINNDFALRTLALENKPISGNQTADVIIESLGRSMELWNLSKAVPVYAIRDNRSNIKSAIRGSAYYDIPCFAHTLQLAIEDAVDAWDELKNMLIKCSKILDHYNHSYDTTRKLEAKNDEIGR